jgi:hypothetical protein
MARTPPAASSFSAPKAVKAAKTSKAKAKKPSSPYKPGKGGGSLGDKAVAILAQLHRVGKDGPMARQSLMTMCGSNNLHSFNVLLSKQKGRGLLEFPDGKTVKITPEGLSSAAAAAGGADGGGIAGAPRTDEELQDAILRMYKIGPGGTPGKVFEYLRRSPREAFALGDVVRASGYQGDNMRSFMVMLGKLTGPKIVVKTGDGRYQLGAMCFLGGGAAAAAVDE